MRTLIALILLTILPTSLLAQPADLLNATTTWQDDHAQPGDQRALAITLKIADHHHINPDAAQIPEDSFAFPTSLEATTDSSLLLGSVQYPRPEIIEVQYAPEPIPTYGHTTRLYLPVVVPDDAQPGTQTIQLTLTYQACDDQVCYPPTTINLEAALTILPRDAEHTPQPADPDLFADFNPASFATVYQDNTTTTTPATGLLRNDLFGLEFTIDTDTPLGVTLVLVVALAAGLLLNITPCVLPVIPIKLMSLHKAAGHRSRALYLGIIFSLGIVLAFFALGLLVAGLVSGLEALEWGQIFSYTPVSITLGIIIVAMALGMMGLYTIQLPNSVYALNPSSDTALGNLLLGILTAVLSTPCTGPMLGATIAWAVKQPPALALITFVAVGVGMAAPYLLLAAFPSLVDRLPRSGPVSEIIKQTMGGLLLAVALFFFGPVIPGRTEWWLIAAVIALTMIYLLIRALPITRSWTARTATTAAAILVAAAGYIMAETLAGQSPLPWQTFTPDAFQQARNDNKHVLLKFTADWCGNCHFLEGTLYRQTEVVRAFDNPDYVAFKVDLTDANAPGWPLQKQLGQGGGIPLAAVYHPGQEQPDRVLQGLYTLEQLLDILTPPAP
ncbi:protein-disulfide reductase DsbD family protein [Mucisphaera calidilacus]|uniref:Thiol:disulfide interchange protein DsbD n=1 Tax=Mucisphaera calidilacus TaxID=2527982 RepID=A0A518C138_9BACT|nr:protein-disulfide reductase DsbD [Mucisphaera calidilacus]QDU72947.1 Thiol:disulfide interchange protein DsbD precursor [Mucisphaera calidilacus]